MSTKEYVEPHFVRGEVLCGRNAGEHAEELLPAHFCGLGVAGGGLWTCRSSACP